MKASFGKATNSSWQNRLINRVGEGLRQISFFPLLGYFTPLKVKGLENLESNTTFIFAPNHSSHLDTLLFLKALPLHLRLKLRVAAAADYFFNRAWKGVAVSIVLNAFPFARKGEERFRSLSQTEKLLKSGHSILIFPEGTRTADGRLQPFKKGVAQLGIKSQTAVVPVWIEGTYASFPKGARWPRRQNVSITFGKPLNFAPGTDPAQVTAEIQRQVEALSYQASGISHQLPFAS